MSFFYKKLSDFGGPFRDSFSFLFSIWKNMDLKSRRSSLLEYWRNTSYSWICCWSVNRKIWILLFLLQLNFHLDQMKKNLRLFSLTILTIFIMVLETIYYKSCFSFNFSHIFWQFLAIFFFSNFLFYCEKRDNFFCQLHPIHFAFFYPYTVFSFCDWRNMIYLNLCIWLIVRKLKTVQFLYYEIEMR